MPGTRVKDVMTHLVVMLYPNETIHGAAKKLARNRVGGAPVVEAGKVVGIVSEADLVHALMPPTASLRGTSVLDVLTQRAPSVVNGDREAATVADVMTSLVIEVAPETSIWKAASIMERRGIKRLPVVDDDGYLLGIVSRADVVKAMARDDDEIAADVCDAIGQLGEETIVDLEVEVVDGVATLRGCADRKSTRDVAVGVAERTVGVTGVVDELTFERDDATVKPAPNPGPDPRLERQPERSVNRRLPHATSPRFSGPARP